MILSTSNISVLGTLPIDMNNPLAGITLSSANVTDTSLSFSILYSLIEELYTHLILFFH